jgi:hypothetical protein
MRATFVPSALDPRSHLPRRPPHARRWDKLGSSSLNEKPDEEEDHTHAYVPQFEVTGQGLHYRTTVTLEEGEAALARSAAPLGREQVLAMWRAGPEKPCP